MPQFIPRLFLILALFCPVWPASLRAAKPAPIVGAAPPQPVELNVRVRREGKTEIPLRVYGKTNEPLKYLIRVPAVHGKLSDPRATEREVSVVVYEPPADLGITTDKFSYAVQSSAGVSAAVEVAITIIDQPAQLEIQDRIDFATVRAGATNSRLLEISNKGGLVASGEVIVDAPWKIEGKTGYRLKPGDIAVFKILFSPGVGGKFEGVARFTSDPEHSTTLTGAAEAAISANPAQWVLQQTPGDTTRTGTFELTNQLDEPRTLQLKADAPLKIAPQVKLPAHGKATVTVEASSDNARAFTAEVHLEGGDFSIAIPVRAPALDAVFRSTSPTISFGRLAAGRDAKTTFELENIGATPGDISWEISPPFRVPENSATLQPGEKKQFALEIDGKVPAKYRTWLKFKAGAQSFDVPVDAEVLGLQRPAGAPRIASTASSSTAADPATPDTVETVPTPTVVVPSEFAHTAVLPKGARVDAITQTSAHIVWPASLSPATRFRVEMRQLRLGPDGKLQATWLQPGDIPIQNQGAEYAALLTNLQPGQPWTVRILPLQASGDAGDPLFTVDFQTAGKTTLGDRVRNFSWMPLLTVVLFLLLGWMGWQRWGPRRVA